MSVFVRAYLRASTDEQHVQRAREELAKFAEEHNFKIAAWYFETESGAKLRRPKLMELIAEACEGDILLVEQIDRLARLTPEDWATLKRLLAEKRIAVVSKELPTSHIAFKRNQKEAGFSEAMLEAVNQMLLDMLAAIARKDYEDRRRRAAQGIARAQANNKYKGRPKDDRKRQLIASLLRDNKSYTEICEAAQCSRYLVSEVVKSLRVSSE